MKRESIVFAISGMFFGLLIGWLLGSQQAGPARPLAMPPQAQAQPPAGSAQPQQAPPALDEARVRELQAQAEKQPKDAALRARLGDLYFDAERYPDAIKWYEESLAIDPKNANVSTDLGVSYYYTNQPDRALAQFERSLAVDPNHTKTMLNMGIVRAFGKQDLEGAAAAWQKVVEIAPDSPEGRAARQALESMRSAHPGLGQPGNGGAQGGKS